MITKKQLETIAKKTSINLFYQEKDYLLNIFLNSLYKNTRHFIFKGGTCLKLVYNYQRFSEDLDFNTNLKPEKIEKVFTKTLNAFALLGIDYEIIKEEKFKSSFTIKIRFKGPLYTGKSISANTISIDSGLRGGSILKPVWKEVISNYPEIPNYFVLAMQEQEILAEKIRALILRGKARDLFDVWCILNKTKINKNLLEKKLAKIKERKISFCSKREYERDLSNLLPRLLPYEQIVNDVKSSLSKIFLQT